MSDERKQRIFDLWLACATQEDIAAELGISRQAVDKEIGLLPQTADLPNVAKVPALFADAAEIKLRAERRLGEMIKGSPKNTGVKLNGRDTFGNTKTVSPKNAAPPTLAESGLTRKQSSTAYNDAAEIKVRSYRHLGEILKDTPMNGGGGDRKSKNYKITGTEMEPVISPPTLAEVGLTKKQSSTAYNYAAEIKVRSYRHLGEILKKTPKNAGGGPGRGKKRDTKTVSRLSDIPTLAESGLTLKQSSTAYNYAAEIKLRAERRLGEMIKGSPKNTGSAGAAKGRDLSGNTVLVSPENTTPTLAESGLTLKQSSTARLLRLGRIRPSLILTSFSAIIT